MDDTAQREVLSFYYRSFANDIGLLTGRDLRDSDVAEGPPMEIADLSGEPLFKDFQITDGHGKHIGVIRSSARDGSFAVVDSIMIGALPIDGPTMTAAVIEQARNDFPGASVSADMVVCYGYPRIGVAVKVAQASNLLSVVYDVFTLHKVRAWKGDALPEGSEAGDREGEPFYSCLDRIPEGAGETSEAWDRSLAFAQERLSSAKTKLAPEDMPSIRGSLLPVELIAQETPVYCAVASTVMILSYLGFGRLEQLDVARALGTGPAGTTNGGMKAGLNALTAGAWGGMVVSKPTFELQVDYLQHLWPAKSGIPGHARVLRGWREYVYRKARTGETSHRESFYIINDPYPVGSGQIVLENTVKPISDFYQNMLNLAPTP
ncbi:C39 family peptidase [Mycobacterium paraseoulense]|uniref:Uncharacterized protein n=1 Tax=Mycobacterium paraseoulense TaxID=590652 RepID=A0A1X0I8S5_9MYCO|nr:C39 family peptidase [Mycobacterium paraseoulense]MCV7398064.1 C39 family peptidase [Mycobacterium paraseoulense]ORB39248.1 hypothetical protein BST39_15825 [Mycobacterium paraseoulense]BBZ74395.1 hypothetical protein MPRS_54880 [Mycobacterium paraseoulense]